MRTTILAVSIATGLVAAGSASAQVFGAGASTGGSAAESLSGYGSGGAPRLPTPSQRYVLKVVELRAKTLKVKADDGGQLTAEHAAGLQQELDALNRHFGIKAG